MSHLLERYDWMFSAVQKPWHGLGTVTENVLTAADAIRTARLDWTVASRPLFRFDEFNIDGMNNAAAIRESIKQLESMGVPIQVGNLRALLNHVVNVREDLPFADPASDLGVVSGSYQTIQNSACFNLCDRIVGRLGASYETAGSLMDGKRVFMTACCPKDLQIADDIVRPYLLLSTAHDGTSSLEVKLVMMRVVCWNTLSAALAENTSATVRVKHTAGSVDSSGNVRQSLVHAVKNDLTKQVESKALDGNAASGNVGAADALISSVTNFMSRQASILSELAAKTITRQFVSDYLHVMVPTPIKGNPSRSDNKRQSIADIYYGTMPGDATIDDRTQQQAIALDRETGNGTAYRLFNAITHYNDHVATTAQRMDKNAGKQKSFAESRFTRITKTGGFRDDAMNVLTEALDSNGESLRDALAKHQEAKSEYHTRQLITCSN